ncbi:unnamed protein product [Miscanthus lutarioriparius]|uniref:Phytocyanin domain-containing protein n=1 Tax=Miscanthus lutarioriparius TaxID=422564 RepID=A0A811NP43_9POAL|nr:unnamed protein product [Miscanthus lutarioriparius]
MAANASSRATVLLFAVYASLASATTYTVGGVHSWMTGVDYADWASGKTFVVGDKLLFSYVRTDHTVTKVSKSEYDACSGSDAKSEDNTSGLTTVTLATPGMHYFICIMPDHCAGGMKLVVNVSVTASAGSGGLEVTGTNAGGGLLVPVKAPVVAAATVALIELGLL